MITYLATKILFSPEALDTIASFFEISKDTALKKLNEAIREGVSSPFGTYSYDVAHSKMEKIAPVLRDPSCIAPVGILGFDVRESK